MNLKRIDTDRYLRDFDFLLEVTRETLSTLQLGSLLRRIVRLMRERFGYDYAAVALVQGEEVVFRAGSGGNMDQVFELESSQQSWHVRLGQGIVGSAAHSAKPRLVGDVLHDPDYLAVDFLSQTRSELTVPLIHHEKVLGVLDVQSHQVNAFDESDVRLLEIVSALMAPAVHIASLYEKERTRSRHLHLVGEISRLVLSSLDLEHVISVACEAILEALDISFAVIALVDRSGLHIVHGGHATRLPLFPETDFRLELGEGLVGDVIAAGSSRCLDDVSTYPNFRHLVPGMRSALCVPLRVRERIIGAVDVEHASEHHFTAEDQRLLENIAVYLAQAVENAQLFDNQRRRWQQLLVINEVARVATEYFDLEAILHHVAKEVHDRFGYFAVAVKLFEEGEVVLRALQCDEALDLEVGYREKLEASFSGRVIRSGAPILAHSPAEFARGAPLRQDIQSILTVPLLFQSTIIGVIEAQSLEAAVFSDDDLVVIQTLAQSVAGAIANAQSIRQTEQLREDLNQMIVHDLRNPVQAVLLTLQEVHQVFEGTFSMSIVDSVKESITCSEDILEMINSLLDVSRFEAGKAQLRLAPAALNDHIRATVRRFAPHARAKGIQLTAVLSQDVPVVRIDRDLITRLLTNLVGNAVKFTPDRACVTVRSEFVTEPRDDLPGEIPLVLVAVQDTGEGIPAEYHKMIFEKFGQVESRKAGLKMSTGLGLALCRYVINAHGGQIWVKSTPGKGSAFFFTLPVTKRAPVEP